MMGKKENEMQSVKVVLFGAGKNCKKVMENTKYDVLAVIDNNNELHGKSIFGKNIISLDEYKELYRGGVKILISSSRYADEIKKQLYANGIFDVSIPPELYEDPAVSKDEKIAHGNWIDYLTELCDKPGMRVLEVGSRIETSDGYRKFRSKWKNASYTGFDYYMGNNVDIAGDAHKLSSYFQEKFDLIFSSAVFEHLAMPWLVSIEMVKLLNKGGYVFIETHYSFSSHERPWHFFQFSENALDVLFPRKFGMKCARKSVSNLLEARFSTEASEYLRGRIVGGMYCHSEYLGQKIEDMDDKNLDWSCISLEDVSGGMEYPAPSV